MKQLTVIAASMLVMTFTSISAFAQSQSYNNRGAIQTVEVIVTLDQDRDGNIIGIPLDGSPSFEIGNIKGWWKSGQVKAGDVVRAHCYIKPSTGYTYYCKHRGHVTILK